MNQLELPMPISGLPLDLRSMAAEIHQANITAGWWKQDQVGEAWIAGVYHPPYVRTLNRNIGELLALVHSEISEADEGFEFELMDDKLPHRQMGEVELADTAIRVLDILGFYDESWIYPGSDTAPLRLPEFAYWSDWCRMMHRETTKALEGFRKGNNEKGCSHLVRLLGIIHFAAITFNFDLTGAIAEKRAFNAQRADHKIENRTKAGGKTF